MVTPTSPVLGVDDPAAAVAASTRLSVDHVLAVGRSIGHRHVGLDTPSRLLELWPYQRRALARDAHVPADGSGSHRLAIGSDLEPFTNRDGSARQALAPADAPVA